MKTHSPGRVAAFIKMLVGTRFESQKDLAVKAGMNPSSLHAAMKSQRVDPITLERLLSVLTVEEQKRALTAAVQDAVPNDYVGLLMKDGVVAIEAKESGLSPLAEAMLGWLTVEARRDPTVQSSLEMQARWVGLDKPPFPQ